MVSGHRAGFGMAARNQPLVRISRLHLLYVGRRAVLPNKLAAWESQFFDLILMDVPDARNGWIEATTMIRKHEASRNLALIGEGKIGEGQLAKVVSPSSP